MKRFLLVALISATLQSFGQKAPEIIIAVDMKNDSLMHAAGYRFIVESISNHFNPLKVDDAAFKQKVEQVKALKTKIYAVNVFIPGNVKAVGPDADEAKTLAYTKQVFERCKALGVNMIVWGSGGSRQRPEGTDIPTATKQFTSLAQKVADQAKPYGITIALEDLNSSETNFLNSLRSCIDMVRAVNRSNFRLSPDIYHMLREGDGPELIIEAKDIIVHCDVAEKDGRTPPGTKGEDFTPYLKALKQIGYKGKIVLECNWSDIPTQAVSAKKELQRQMDLVWSK